jgi:hypothetical protein
MTYEEFEEQPKKTEKEKPKKLGDHAEILAGGLLILFLYLSLS